jgi:hypothetical protein
VKDVRLKNHAFEGIRAYKISQIGYNEVYLLETTKQLWDEDGAGDIIYVDLTEYFPTAEEAEGYVTGLIGHQVRRERIRLLKDGCCPECKTASLSPAWAYCPECGASLRTPMEAVELRTDEKLAWAQK